VAVKDVKAISAEFEADIASGKLLRASLQIENYGFSDHASACAHEALIYLDGTSLCRYC